MIKVAHNILYQKRIIAQIAREGRNACQHRLLVFPVKLIGGGFTVAYMVIMMYLHSHIRGGMLHTSRNTKRRCQFEINRFGIDMQHVLFPIYRLPRYILMRECEYDLFCLCYHLTTPMASH